MVHVLSESEDATFSLGSKLAAALSDSAPGLVIGLTGTLGSGKTALVRGLLVALGVEADAVVSPTYGLIVPYLARVPVLHMDAYRIESVDELDELGLDEQVEQGASLLCEWFEKVEQGLPEIDLVIEALPVGPQSRRYEFTARSERGRNFINAAGLGDQDQA